MDTENLIEIKFTGEGISPRAIRAKEIADVIAATEDMLTTIVSEENKHINKNDIIIGLVGIQEGSIDLQFIPQMPTPVIAASEIVATAINTKRFTQLPYPAVKSLRTISSFIRRHNCNMQFKALAAKTTISATLTPQVEIETLPPIVGETVLYGTVLRVGGKDAHIMFETIQGDTVFCKSDRKLARQLGPRLYTLVGLSGQAVWNADTLELEEFTATKMLGFEPTPITQAISDLSAVAGPYFDQIQDVDQYIRELRSDS